MRMKGHRYCCSGTLLCVDVEILKIRCSHLSIGEIDRRVGDLWAIFGHLIQIIKLALVLQ